MPKHDPEEIVAEAVAKLPMSSSAGCMLTLLFGLGAIQLVLGIIVLAPFSIVTGAVALAVAAWLFRNERVNVVRRITVRAGGHVEVAVGKEERDLFVGDLMELFVASGRGRSQLTLRGGTKLRVASPMDGLDEVAAAIKQRHKGFVAKGI